MHKCFLCNKKYEKRDCIYIIIDGKETGIQNIECADGRYEICTDCMRALVFGANEGLNYNVKIIGVKPRYEENK